MNTIKPTVYSFNRYHIFLHKNVQGPTMKESYQFLNGEITQLWICWWHSSINTIV